MALPLVVPRARGVRVPVVVPPEGQLPIITSLYLRDSYSVAVDSLSSTTPGEGYWVGIYSSSNLVKGPAGSEIYDLTFRSASELVSGPAGSEIYDVTVMSMTQFRLYADVVSVLIADDSVKVGAVTAPTELADSINISSSVYTEIQFNVVALRDSYSASFASTPRLLIPSSVSTTVMASDDVSAVVRVGVTASDSVAVNASVHSDIYTGVRGVDSYSVSFNSIPSLSVPASVSAILSASDNIASVQTVGVAPVTIEDGMSVWSSVYSELRLTPPASTENYTVSVDSSTGIYAPEYGPII
jgi:hypothetical protein